jgi:hypothetical protein
MFHSRSISDIKYKVNHKFVDPTDAMHAPLVMSGLERHGAV